MNIIAIDPGMSGGIAWRINGCYGAYPMPVTTPEIAAGLSIIAPANTRVYIEKVGGVHGSDPKALMRLKGVLSIRQQFGELRGICIALGLSIEEVTPQKWMNKVCPGHPTSASGKLKNYIKGKVQERYPMVNPTLKTADALGILWYAETLGEGA